MSDRKSVVTRLPDYQLERLAEPLEDIVEKYFENPDVQKRYEEWLPGYMARCAQRAGEEETSC